MNDKKFYVKDVLTEDDLIEESKKSLSDLIREAQDEALKRGIKANTVVINKNIVEVKPFVIKNNIGFSELPPMICGLQAFFTDRELPEDYAFAILETTCTEREALIQQTRENSIKEFLNELKKLSFPEGGCGLDCVNKNDMYKVAEKMLGTKLGEVDDE